MVEKENNDDGGGGNNNDSEEEEEEDDNEGEESSGDDEKEVSKDEEFARGEKDRKAEGNEEADSGHNDAEEEEDARMEVDTAPAAADDDDDDDDADDKADKDDNKDEKEDAITGRSEFSSVSEPQGEISYRSRSIAEPRGTGQAERERKDRTDTMLANAAGKSDDELLDGGCRRAATLAAISSRSRSSAYSSHDDISAAVSKPQTTHGGVLGVAHSRTAGSAVDTPPPVGDGGRWPALEIVVATCSVLLDADRERQGDAPPAAAECDEEVTASS